MGVPQGGRRDGNGSEPTKHHRRRQNDGGNGGNGDGGGGQSLADRILNHALSFIGVPYVWGGTSRQGVDCSGLVQQVYNHFGLNLPRIADAQARVGQAVSAKNARPGDLVYFENNSSEPGYDHIGIYIGHGKMIVAPHTGTNVQIQDVGNATGFDRVLPDHAFNGMQNQHGEYVWHPPNGQNIGHGQMNVSHSAASGNPADGGGPGGAGGGGGGNMDTAKPQSVNSYLDNPDVASKYGYLAAYLHNPEVGPILARAAKHGWGQDELLGALSKTHWWKTTSESARSWEAQKRLDPATAHQTLGAMRQHIQQLAKSTLGAGFNPGRLNSMANAAIAGGWNDAQLQRAVGAEFKFHGRNAAYTGAAGQTVDTLQQMSQQYLVPISHDTMQKWSKNILEGNNTADDFKSYLQSQAESLYPTLSHALKQGQTVLQYADPYLQMASQILEKPVGNFNLFNPKWGRALNQTGPDGERKPMALADWGDYLRGLPEYRHTQQAQQQASAFTVSLGNIFGKISTPSGNGMNAATAVQ